MSTEPSYADRLANLASLAPLVAESLGAAERQRSQRVSSRPADIRLKGVEQFLAYLDANRSAYAANENLAPLTFLIERIRADFTTALEATMSGYTGVAFDAMRDVMEVEALLLDFAIAWPHAREWTHGDAKLRRKKFSPVKVRIRLQEAGAPPYSNSDYEPSDFRGHSEALHVSPRSAFGSGRGLHPFDDSAFGQAGWVEIFEHGRWVLDAIDRLRLEHSESVGDSRLPLPMEDFFAAGRLTHTNQSLVLAIFRALNDDADSASS